MTRIPFALRAGTALFAMTRSPRQQPRRARCRRLTSRRTRRPRRTSRLAAATSSSPVRASAAIRFRRIRRSRSSTRQDIAKTGLNSINDVLQRLPSSGGGLNGKFNNSGNLGNPPDGGGVGAGAAEIDLRYLGSRRTLVLVDGLRFVNGASASGVPGSTDLNSIPESMIERIEVLQDGASAIYGSDAIAGVVNIITKQRQDGLLASAQVGSYLDEGDGSTQNYQLSWGNGGDGPLQVVVGGNYVKQRRVSAGDRAISRFPQPYGRQLRGTAAVPASFRIGRYIGALFGGDTDADRAGHPSGPLRRRPISGLSSARPTDSISRRSTISQIPLERYGVFGNLKYGSHGRYQLHGQGASGTSASRRTRRRRCRFGIGPARASRQFSTRPTIDATNPFNPFGVDARRIELRLRSIRRFVRRRTSPVRQTVETYYGVATLDGKFNVGGQRLVLGREWPYGKNKAKQTMLGNINSRKLRQALGPLATCNATPGCVPVQLVRRRWLDHPGMIDYITLHPARESEQTDLGFHGQRLRQPFRSSGRRRSDVAAGRRVSRAQAAASIRIRSLRPASARTFRRSRRRAITTSRKPMPS